MLPRMLPRTWLRVRLGTRISLAPPRPHQLRLDSAPPPLNPTRVQPVVAQHAVHLVGCVVARALQARSRSPLRRAPAGCSCATRWSAAGAVPHLAEPVETRALRGSQAARQDRSRGRALAARAARRRPVAGGVDPARARPSVALTRARLRHTLIDERTQWMQRIQATLFHHGVSGTPAEAAHRAKDASSSSDLALPADARERIMIALAMVDAIDARIAPLERELRQLARRQAGCRALMGLYGMGELTSLITLCGARRRPKVCRRRARRSGWPASTSACTAPIAAPGLANSTARAPRICAGRSMRPRSSACRPSSPDHADYLALKARTLSAPPRVIDEIARKLARRSFHVLRELGPAALDPVHHDLNATIKLSSVPPPAPTWLTHFRPAPAAIAAPTPSRWRPTKDRAAGVAPPGLTDQPSRHRPPLGRGPR